MNATNGTFDLDTLSAYLDGELDEATAREVEHYLDQNPEAHLTLADYRRQDSALRVALAATLEEPVPNRFSQLLHSSPAESDAVSTATPHPRSFWPGRFSLAAATGVFALCIGAFSGWQVRSNMYQMEAEQLAINMFLQQATNSYSMFAGGERSWGSDGLRTDRDAFTEWFESALDVSISTPDFEEPGFQFVGGRALPVSSRGAAGQILYENEAGQVVAIYFQVDQSDDSPTGQRARLNGSAQTNGAGQNNDLPATFVQRNDLPVYYWRSQSSSISYAIMGDIDRDILTSLARAILDQFGD